MLSGLIAQKRERQRSNSREREDLTARAFALQGGGKQRRCPERRHIDLSSGERGMQLAGVGKAVKLGRNVDVCRPGRFFEEL